MENQENINIPINPISNPNFLNSPVKIQNFSKNNNLYSYNQSPFPSRIAIYNTPNKSYENDMLYSNYGETPFNYFIPLQMSPVDNTQNLSYKKIQNFTEKKTEGKNYFGNNGNEFCAELRGRNLNDAFNQLQENKINNEQMKNFGYPFDNIENNNNNRKESGMMKINNNNINDRKKMCKIYFLDEKKICLQNNNDNDKNEFINDSNIFEEDKIKVIVDKSLLTDIKTIYGDNLSKKEYTFNSLNSSLISDFSFTLNETYPPYPSTSYTPPYGHPPLFTGTSISRSSKKPLKAPDSAFSYVNNSTTNLSSSERPPSKCNCKNSNCFKLYCECFANGKYCENCACINCKNTVENKELRTEKYNEIILRNPKALQKINSTKRSWTCKCKNSGCLKKYCDCYQNRRNCTSKCKCVNCFNKNIINNNKNNGSKMKRIRGIKNKKNKKDEINSINEEEEFNENNENEINEVKKNKNVDLSTPKKNKNSLNKNEIYVYYDKNEGSTAVMTGKKERKKNITMTKNTLTEKKNKNIYTKLQMDNV